MIIYKVKNKVDGKIYVGQTSQLLRARLSCHVCSNTYFGKALRKYGVQS